MTQSFHSAKHHSVTTVDLKFQGKQLNNVCGQQCPLDTIYDDGNAVDILEVDFVRRAF